jgi:ferredoxin--NADP+ reductase
MSLHESRIPAQLESKQDISDGLSVFRFSLAREFHFKPGQYATLWLTHHGKTIPRPYSIASSPSETRTLEFYINLVEHGRLTPSLWEADVLQGLHDSSRHTFAEITGPRGRFVLDREDPRDLVLVASGTGLAPFISMIRALNEDYLSNPEIFRRRTIYVIHGVSYSQNLGYRSELETLAAETLRDPKRKLAVVYLPTISRPHMDPGWPGLTGRAEALLEGLAETAGSNHDPWSTIKSMLSAILRPETHAVYLCGHPGTIDNLRSILADRGFKPDADVKREKFYT